MRTYTYRRSAFINIADRWNVYLCSWLLELIFAINKGYYKGWILRDGIQPNYFAQNILAYSNKKLCMTAISCYILQNVNIVCILTSSLSFSYYHCHAACSLRSHYQRLLYVGSL